MHKLTIDRRKWLRGKGSKKSTLLDSNTGEMCCIGFYCTNLERLSKPDLVGNLSLVALKRHSIELHSVLANVKATGMYREFYEPNDSVVIKDGEREEILTKNFAKYGIKVRFVN